MEYNVYCDESCHLEHDNFPNMVIGGIYLDKNKKKEINQRISEIKKSYGINKNVEIKWSKLSPARLDLYIDLINYFFDDDDINFRCIIADKTKLDHVKYNQTHDEWYYKIYWEMMKGILSPIDSYNFYVDIKDTRSYDKTQQLLCILCNSQYDFKRSIIKKIQPIRSEEVQVMQLVDILIGAVKSANSIDAISSSAKKEVIELVKKRSGYTLTVSTLLSEKKFNIFKWRPNYYAQ